MRLFVLSSSSLYRAEWPPPPKVVADWSPPAKISPTLVAPTETASRLVTPHVPPKIGSTVRQFASKRAETQDVIYMKSGNRQSEERCASLLTRPHLPLASAPQRDRGGAVEHCVAWCVRSRRESVAAGLSARVCRPLWHAGPGACRPSLTETFGQAQGTLSTLQSGLLKLNAKAA